MFDLYFLSAAKPLTKRFYLGEQGEILKDSYPTVKNFTSHIEKVTTLKDMYNAVVKHSKLNHCMIKGRVKSDIKDSSRAGMTNSTDSTFFMLIDLDRSPFESAEDFMNSDPYLKDVSYIVQYSSSYGIFPDKKLSCHIYVMLEELTPAPTLKGYLQSLNVLNEKSRSGIELSRTGATLHYPVDITTCQNDKLIYIAPPIIEQGVKCTVTDSERIQYVNKKNKAMSSAAFKALKSDVYRAECRKLLNDMRVAQGKESLSKSTVWIGEYEVQSKPGAATITGMRKNEDFTYFNLNGGDSWSYFHKNDNFELIHCFKHMELSFKTKELLPDYYKECKRNEHEIKTEQRETELSTPTKDGSIVLAFCDAKSDQYYRGTWNQETASLKLYEARDATRLRDYCAAMGKMSQVEDFIPSWDYSFEPNKDYIVDLEKQKVNAYVPSPFMRKKEYAPPADWRVACPLIYKIIKFAVSNDVEDELFEHFMNWLAVIFQTRKKTLTAWILTGVEGTGKGLIINKIVAPIIGPKYVAIRRGTELEEHYNGYLENTLFVFIDEVQIGHSSKAVAIMANLKQAVTEPNPTVRHMRKNAYEIVNYANFVMSSNFPDPAIITEGDRRFNTGIFQPLKLEGIGAYEVDHVIPQELEAFTAYIMTREIDVDKANTIMHNETRQSIIETSRSSLEDLGIQIKKGQLEKLWDSMPDLNLIAMLHNDSSANASAYADIIKEQVLLVNEKPDIVSIKDPKTKISTRYCVYQSKLSRDQLFVIFEHCVGSMPKTPNKFSALLGHRGLKVEPVLVNDKTVRGVYVKWMITEEKLNSIIKELNIKPKLSIVGKPVPKAQIKIGESK